MRLLADEPRLTLIVAGRSLASAQAFCAELQASAATVPAAFDRDGDVEAQLRALAPDIVVDATGPFQVYGANPYRVEAQLRALAPNLVVDATGPFQVYGANPYRVVRAAIALGIDYLDLADGSDFVRGVAQFDAQARARGVFVLAGVSSFPVLTAAVVRRLTQGLTRVDTIKGGIAPSPYANVGMNVIRAITSYAGKPVEVVRDGRKTTAYAIIDNLRYTIAPPGRLPLYPVRFSLVDVPDLKLLPELWPGVRTVWMGAGPVPEFLHRALNAFAWLVRLKLLPSLLPLAPLIHWAVGVLSFGEHRGGMFVAVEGADANGQPVTRSWHMIAEGDDGPLIPSMAAEAVIRHCLAGRAPAIGARGSVTDLELSDYEPLFARRRIVTGFRTSLSADATVYRQVLGDALDKLPAALQAMHDVRTELTAEGMATVERGKGLLARLVALVIGFPQAGENVPVMVRFRVENGREHWQRTFAGRSFSSTQEAGRGRFEHLLCERFGPLNAGMALVLEDGRMRLVVRRWSFLGIPMPLALAPRGNSYEFAQDGRFHFHVEIGLPFTGLIVAYRGWLVPRT